MNFKDEKKNARGTLHHADEWKEERNERWRQEGGWWGAPTAQNICWLGVFEC